jgi:integrase
MRDTKLPIFTRQTKRGRYWYCHVRTADGRRLQRALHIRDDGSEASRRAAVAAYWQEQARATAGKYDRGVGASTARPLGEALAALLAQQELAGVVDGTQKNTTQRGKHLLDHFGARFDLTHLTTQAMVSYASKALEHRAPTTVREEITTLTSAARAVGLIPQKRPRMKARAKPQRPLTREQVRLFFLALKPKQKLLGLTLITLGLRTGEVKRIGDVDWSAGTLWIHGTKTVGSRRQLPIPQELFAHMLELRAAGKWQGFPKVTDNAIDKAVRAACLRAFGEPRSVNDIRGTWSTLAALEGVPPDIRAAWQGNSVRQQEQTYAQPALMPEEMRRAAERGVPRVRSKAPCITGAPASAVSAANAADTDAPEVAESHGNS